MQKALQQMNVQLIQVLRDITGMTGLAIGSVLDVEMTMLDKQPKGIAIDA